MELEVKVVLANAMEEELDFMCEQNSADIYEFLSCCKVMQDELEDERRWWQERSQVVEISDNIFLEWEYAKATGDSTPSELGWEPPSISTIRRVHPTTVTKVVYS